MNIPELLCPAGSMDALDAALHFGADAVYGGMKRFGLRAFAGNFDEPSLRRAVQKTHEAGKKFYLTLNVFPFDDQMDAFVGAARLASVVGVDAAIVSDLGAIVTLRREVPGLPIHVSTQANTVNAAAVRHYYDLGCTRVILAREVGLERIRRMKAGLGNDMELEVFAHGAACMAYSGRCMLSAALTGRSANQGACAQPCRWAYAVTTERGTHAALPVAEDENGTYLFSARDLNLMPILPELVGTGISSLKIEGRMKTEFYVATVVGAYRRALDALAKGEDAFRAMLPALLDELNSCSHRESDTGFMLGSPEAPGGAEGFYQTKEYVARAAEDAEPGEEAVFVLKNRFHTGDQLELMTAQGIRPLHAVDFLREKTGETLSTLGIAGERIRMRVDTPVRAGDLVRGPVRNHREA